MKYFGGCRKIGVYFLFVLSSLTIKAQGEWGAYSQKIDVKKYAGHAIKFSAWIRAEIDDDLAGACLWMRVDKEKGIGFVDDMQNRPVRSNDWKEYVIEGKINTDGINLAFGAFCLLNGKFYYDDLKLEVETDKGKWTTLFAADFEDNKNALIEGFSRNDMVSNSHYKAEVIALQRNKSKKCLLITGKNVPNYGSNKEAGKFADVNGIKLYYEIYGDGPPLLVLHGNGGSIADAGNFYPELIKKYKVIAIDNRAQGRSGDTDAPLTYDQMASDINVLLEQLKIDSTYIWGQSDGAILGLLMAMDYPKKVKRVIAFGANIQPDSLAVFEWDVEVDKKAVKESKNKKEAKLAQLMLDYPNVPFAKLHTIKAPVLVMAGDRDVIKPEHTLKIFQNIPNSQLFIVPGATHGACWENEEMFLKTLNDFFTKPFKMPDTKDWFQTE